MSIHLIFRFNILLWIIALSIAEAPPKLDCLAAYARSKGVDVPTFDSINYNISNQDCVNIRHTFISNLRNQIRRKLDEIEIDQKQASCIYRTLMDSEIFMNSAIKAAALEYTMESSKGMNISEIILNAIKTSIVTCRNEKDYGVDFDSYFDLKETINYTDSYCIKKYLIKNNLINNELYEIDPNPRKIDFTGLVCEDIIRRLNDEVNDQINAEFFHDSKLDNAQKVECALEKYREAEYFDFIMQMKALATLNITTEQKQTERDNFIRFMSEVADNVATCY